MSLLRAVGIWFAALFGIASAPGASLPKALKDFNLADGLVIELATGEPDLGQPVYLTFDERGRMWVAQYLQYPFPEGLKVVGHDEYWRVKYDRFPPPAPPNHIKGADKITIFEDDDGDGYFESHKDFVTGLNICTAALPGRGGVWVLNPPYLLFYPDANRDDVPDGDPSVHLAGFGLEDLHAVANSLTWGPDGWLYGCQGSTCTATITRPGLDEEGTHFNGQCIWRYHPKTRRFELFAEGGYNNFGIAFDRKFRLFTGTNGGKIGVHYVQGAYYQKNWGKHGPLTNPYAFGYFDAMPDRSSQAKLSQAMIVYEAQEFPEEYRGWMLVARVLQHRIDLCELRPEGSTYSAHELKAICSTADRQFRPVDVKMGPDGSVYIADWHEDNVTWNTTAEGHGVKRASGRIYRLRFKDTPRPKPFDLARLSAGELMALLSHPNIWHRQTALRLLADRGDRALVSKFQSMVEQNSGQLALEALWATRVSGGSTLEFMRRQLSHSDPFVRLWTIRLLGDDNQITPSISAKLAELARSEPEVQVRSQLACTAKRLSAPDALAIVQCLAARAEDSTDPHLPLLLWWVVEDKLRTDRAAVLAWLQNRRLWQTPLFQTTIILRLGQRFTTERNLENLEICAQLLDFAPEAQSIGHLVQGMVRGLSGDKVEQIPPALDRKLTALRRQGPEAELINLSIRLGQPDALADAVESIRDARQSESRRITLLRLLAERGENAAVSLVIELLQRDSSSALRAEALNAAQRFSDEQLACVIIAALPNWDRGLRDKALTILASRPSWARQLVMAVDHGEFRAKQVSPDVVLAMHSLPDPQAQQLLQKHWGTIRKSPEEKRLRMAALKKVLAAGKGNGVLGKTIYDQTCAKCHVLFEEGTRVGPDLTGLERDNLDLLLQSVIDPSAVILPEYLASQFTVTGQNVAGEEDQLLTGFILEETANSVTIMNTAGAQTVVPKASIAQRQPLTLSIMPEGLLDALNDQQIRDLVAYLQSDQPLFTAPKAKQSHSMSGK